ARARGLAKSWRSTSVNQGCTSAGRSLRHLRDEAVRAPSRIDEYSGHVAVLVDPEYTCDRRAGRIDASKDLSVVLEAVNRASGVRVDADDDARRIDILAQRRQGAGHLEGRERPLMDG